MSDIDSRALLQRAKDSAASAYARYSGEPKGAAILCSDGSVYAAGNVEFASYGGSVCAELAALTKAISEGKRQFQVVALFPYRYPCGNCRQFLSEFGLDVQVITACANGDIESKSLPELLPLSFDISYLG